MNSKGRRITRRTYLKRYFALCESCGWTPVPDASQLRLPGLIAVIRRAQRHARERVEDAPLEALIYEELR